MLKKILYPTYQNAFVWLSTIYLLVLLFLGKVEPMTIIFVYFIETIIIGIFNAIKMFWCIQFGVGDEDGLGLVLFFLFHYGFFVAIQSIFGFAIFSMGDNSSIKEPFNLIENYTNIFQLDDIKYALPAILVMHIGLFFTDFLKNKKHLKFSAKEIMFMPYVRIFVQQFVVILSTFFIILSDQGNIAALILIFFRLMVDLVLSSIKENSKTLDVLAEKLANEKASKEEIKKQLITMTE